MTEPISLFSTFTKALLLYLYSFCSVFCFIYFLTYSFILLHGLPNGHLFCIFSFGAVKASVRFTCLYV